MAKRGRGSPRKRTSPARYDFSCMDPDHAKDLGDVVELKGVSLKRALFSAGQHLKKASAWDGSKAIVCIQRHRKKGDWLDRAGAPPPEDL